MSDPATPTRLIVTADSILKMPRHIKLRHDAGRGRWIILAPERVFEPDETSVEVLRMCTGETSVGEISKKLAAHYEAPVDVILVDVIDMLQDLADKGVLKS